MKNNTFRVLVCITVLLLFCTVMTGCDSVNQTEQTTSDAAEQATATVTEKETADPLSQSEPAEKLTGYSSAYSKVIAEVLKESKEKYPDETNYGQYGLYDFDGDGVPELFLEIYGSAVPDDYIRVYDYEGGKAVYLDSIQAVHSWVYGVNRDKSLLLGCFSMGECAWSLLSFRDGKFESEYIASYFPDGYGELIEPQENPLPGMGYESEDIKAYGLDDLTGLKK